MLEAIGLTKRYPGVVAVNNVSFTIRPGEILGYLGPNGSGKTTTVTMLAGMLEPSAGKVLYEGSDFRKNLIEYKRRLGYVPEEPHLYTYLTGREYLQLAGRLRELPEGLLNEKIDALLHLFSLYSSRHAAIASYSKGMRQKVLIAAALLHDPKLLIFDEPLSGLDVNSAMVFKSLTQSLARAGKMILYSSHVLEVVEKICTRVIILRKGNVVADDSVERLRHLMSLPSLEDIFSQLALTGDPDKTAAEIVQVMRAGGAA